MSSFACNLFKQFDFSKLQFGPRSVSSDLDPNSFGIVGTSSLFEKKLF